MKNMTKYKNSKSLKKSVTSAKIDYYLREFGVTKATYSFYNKDTKIENNYFSLECNDIF